LQHDTTIGKRKSQTVAQYTKKNVAAEYYLVSNNILTYDTTDETV